MSTTYTPAQWERRENMGASPIAIHTAELIREDLAILPSEMHGIVIAAYVDAAFRKAGVPELLAALEDVATSLEEESRGSRFLAVKCERARAAIQKARGGK